MRTVGIFGVGFTAIAAAAGAGGEPSSGNWFFASAFTSPFNDRFNSSTYPNIISEAEHIIGSGARSKLRVMMPNWSFSSGSNNFPAAISKMSIECNGVRTPVTFSASRSTTMTAGQTKLESDDILPATFGLANFAVGTRLYLVIDGPAVTGTNRFILSPRKSPSSRCKMYQYNPATTTASTDSVGALSFSGGTDFATFGPGATISNANTEIAATLIGTFVGADQPVWLAVGDSIEWGVGANDGTNNIGSWLHRGFFDADLSSNPVAHQLMCLSGNKYSFMAAVSSQVAAWAAYANRGYDGLATNDFGNPTGTVTTLAQVQTYSTNLWTAMRGAGITKVYKHKLLASITSASSSSTTEAGQAITGTGWDTGGNVENYNAWLDTQISGSALTGIIPITGITGVNPRKWAVDGVTAKLMTPDGLHPSEYAHSLMATPWRATRVGAA